MSKFQSDQNNANNNPFGEIIYRYTRSQAITDGELVDVSAHARRLGFRFPVAITRSVWAAIETIPKRFSCEDITGRTHDVLWMASLAARNADAGQSRIPFQVILHSTAEPPNRRVHTKTYFLDIGPGDEAEPVITIGSRTCF